MRITLDLKKGNQHEILEVDFPVTDTSVSPTALDVILFAQRQIDSEMSCRYGCRNRNCGLCTIEINGKPRLACHTNVKEGDRLSPLKTLPVIRDFVVQRNLLNEQIRRHQAIPAPVVVNQSPPAEFESLNRCIDCLACLDQCPLHQQNPTQSVGSDPYEFGTPYTFLNLRRMQLDPAAGEPERNKILAAAKKLGIADCPDCEKCRCLKGINLVQEVIRPLLMKRMA